MRQIAHCTQWPSRSQLDVRLVTECPVTSVSSIVSRTTHNLPTNKDNAKMRSATLRTFW